MLFVSCDSLAAKEKKLPGPSVCWESGLRGTGWATFPCHDHTGQGLVIVVEWEPHAWGEPDERPVRTALVVTNHAAHLDPFDDWLEGDLRGGEELLCQRALWIRASSCSSYLQLLFLDALRRREVLAMSPRPWSWQMISALMPAPTRCPPSASARGDSGSRHPASRHGRCRATGSDRPASESCSKPACPAS